LVFTPIDGISKDIGTDAASPRCGDVDGLVADGLGTADRLETVGEALKEVGTACGGGSPPWVSA
jgi:hypothetical protein